MPRLSTGPDGAVEIDYEVRGEGFPVLMLAPGGMRSSREKWAAVPWPLVEDLAERFRVILMDQRNAGASRAPIRAGDGWRDYTADQLALLDHLGIERCHAVGMCIGGPFVLALAHAAPERIAAGVLLQPIGLDDNRGRFESLFEGWREEVAPGHPEADAAAFAGLRDNLFGTDDFVFALDQAAVARIPVPLLVLRGDDPYHPARVSEAVAGAAPRAELLHAWKEGVAVESARQRVLGFLGDHAGTR